MNILKALSLFAVCILLMACEILLIGHVAAYSWNALIVPATQFPHTTWKAFGGILLIYMVMFKCVPPDTYQTFGEICKECAEKLSFIGIWALAVYLLA